MATGPRWPWLLAILGLAVAAAVFVSRRTARAPEAAVTADAPAEGVTEAAPPAGELGQLTTTNEAGRSGAYYLPAVKAESLPVLVLIHGTGGSGRGYIRDFQALAEQHAFAIVAPDSRKSPDGQLTWQVGDAPGEVTPDLTHVMACIDELVQRSGGRVARDAGDMLIAGHSGGASTAPYVSTNRDGFSAFAVLHGGVFANGFGSRRPRGWFSTGSADSLRPPASVRAALDAARAKGLSADYHEFPGGHNVGSAEAAALVKWWRSGAR